MKRKAFELEEDVNADWPSFDYSSNASTASPESVKANAEHDRTHALWNVSNVPYYNSRTRKRYRDGRPNEETIHQNTLAKLFNAQRQIHTEEQRADWQGTSLPTLSRDQYASTGTAYDSTLTLRLPSALEGQLDQNQRSIHSFFGGDSRATGRCMRPQKSGFAFSTMRTDQPALLHCEDCNTALQSLHTHAVVLDTDMMSMDVDPRQDEWACASCSRRVCDLCAVRGDQRICLECAVPGGGKGFS